MSNTWPLTPLGDVLTERQDSPNPLHLEQGLIPVVSKISFDRGQIEFRADGQTKTNMITIRPGDLVVSGINAAKGAIAIYSQDLKSLAAATIHYGAYSVDDQRADHNFLWWMLRSHSFRELLQQYVPGGIKTELKAKRLLPVPIPLPPLAEQRWIVAKIGRLAAKIDEARMERSQSSHEAAALVGCILNRLADLFPDRGPLSRYLSGKPRNGWSARCDGAPDGVPVLSLSAVTGFRYCETEFKRTSLQTE